MDVSARKLGPIPRRKRTTHLYILEHNPLQRILLKQPIQQVNHVTRLLRHLPMWTPEVPLPSARRHLIGAHRLGDLEILVRDHLEQLELARRVERNFGKEEAVERDAEGPDIDRFGDGRAFFQRCGRGWTYSPVVGRRRDRRCRQPTRDRAHITRRLNVPRKAGRLFPRRSR